MFIRPAAVDLQIGRETIVPAYAISIPPVMREFCWTVLGLSFMSVLYCLVMHFGLHWPYPYSWPFFVPTDRFNDFTIYHPKFEFFHTAEFFNYGYPFTYPAPISLVYEAFYKLGGAAHSLRLFLIFIVLSFSIPAILFGRALRARGLSNVSSIAMATLVTVLSWPALLIFDRANMEVMVWCALATGVWAYSRGKDWTAAGLFGLAASMKLFPFVYLALFLNRRQFPKVLFGAASFFFFSIVSLAALGPTVPIAYHGIEAGLAYFHNVYMAHYLPGEGGVDHSILAFLRLAIHAVLRKNDTVALAELLRVYLPVSAILGLILYFWRIYKMPRLNRLLALTIASIYFTPFSGDGTLVHLYYSFALFCFLAMDAWRRHLEIPGLRVVFFCFAYLFSTESFLIISNHRVEGQGKCVVLGILLFWSLRYPFGTPLHRESPTAELAYPNAALIETGNAPI